MGLSELELRLLVAGCPEMPLVVLCNAAFLLKWSVVDPRMESISVGPDPAEVQFVASTGVSCGADRVPIAN